VSKGAFVAPVCTQTWLKHNAHSNPLRPLPFGDPIEFQKNRIVNKWYVERHTKLDRPAVTTATRCCRRLLLGDGSSANMVFHKPRLPVLQDNIHYSKKPQSAGRAKQCGMKGRRDCFSSRKCTCLSLIYHYDKISNLEAFRACFVVWC
jgi:hypothetical protein